MEFPHLNDTKYPNVDNVDVYRYENEFDYQRFDNAQMEIMICNVPWDMGEAHIGARTISGIGNVVFFESKANRDAWFTAVPDNQCYRKTTKYRQLHRDNMIDVELPFDIASRFNYLKVHYYVMTSEDQPIAYEGLYGLRDWFYFIREVEFVSPNTTRLHLMIDAWQTFIYDINITGMFLERGHAPMLETSASQFLSDPLANSDFCVGEDVNVGNPTITQETDVINFSEDTIPVIVCSADATDYFGTKADNDWFVPARTFYTVQGAPTYMAFTVSDLDRFFETMRNDVPQFAQCVKCLCFVPAALIETDSRFYFGDCECWTLRAVGVDLDLMQLRKSSFNYDAKYADIAKLYTFPYAYISVSDENGAVTDIRIEDTHGDLSVYAKANIIYPWLSIDAKLNGIGNASRQTLTISAIEPETTAIAGNWNRWINRWNIPTFGIFQNGYEQNDYSTHYDREQTRTAYTNTRANANASADTELANENASAATELANANASADTAKTNTDASADTIIDNADLQIAANDANTTADNSYRLAVTDADRLMNNDQAAAANTYISVSTNNDVAAADAQAAIGAASAGVTGAASAITNAVTGNIPGAIGALIGSGAQVASTIASNNVAVNLKTAQAAVAQSSNSTNAAQSNANMNSKNTAQTFNASAHNTAANDLTEGAADNNAATMKANASRTNTTQKANASRTNTTQTGNATRTNTTQKANAARDASTAQSSIENQIQQASIRAPFEFGTWMDGNNQPTRARGVYASVVTEKPAEIAYAGDQMLRYGYMFNRVWEFGGNWNLGKYFTYWKLSDFFVSGLSIPDMYVDRLRFFLYGGVTVWRNPSDIGNRTIYENF